MIQINTSLLNVLWCYSETESVKNINISNTSVNYFKGIPNPDNLETYSSQIIVLDDLMGDINKEIKDLFTKLSHHKNISVILIVQNLFNQNRFMRDISLNTHYFILMKGLRNLQQIKILGQQIFGDKAKNLVKIFKHATDTQFGYLIIDVHPHSNDKYRLRTRIFREELTPELAKKHSFCPIFYDKNKQWNRIKLQIVCACHYHFSSCMRNSRPK